MTNNTRFLIKANLEADKQILEQLEKDGNWTPSQNELFLMGANYVLQLFNNYFFSQERNSALEQQSNETSEQYEYRLRDELVEHMVSNRGYASCLSDEKV